MKIKKINTKEYFEYFAINETKLALSQDNIPSVKYVNIDLFLPKFFIFQIIEKEINENIPDRINLNLELVGYKKGAVNYFIFKPWIINVTGSYLLNILEDFELQLPDILFFNLINRYIFEETISPNNFRNVKVLNNFPLEKFQMCGLLDNANPIKTETSRLIITKIDNLEIEKIKIFYSKNSNQITSDIEKKYFRPHYNVWYQIENKSSKDVNNKKKGFFSSIFKNNSNSNIIGYIRLYQRNNINTGGISIEYIISKENRGKGFATEATLAIIEFVKKNSYSISIGAEVEPNNLASIKIMNKLNFKKIDNQFLSDNYMLDILNDFEQIKETKTINLNTEEKSSLFVSPKYEFLDNQRKIKYSITLKGKLLDFTFDFNSDYNVIITDSKYSHKSKFSSYTPSKSIEAMSDDLTFFIKELNETLISENDISKVLEDYCKQFITKNNRLIDGDISGFADMLLLIFEKWHENNLEFNKGSQIRTRIIVNIINKYSDYIFIHREVMPGQFVPEKYTGNSLGEVFQIY